MPIEPYFRRVFYYETDRMGFVHHSNYIRWLEEARMDYMRKLGIDCKLLEDQGIIIPVTGVSCEYRQSVYFDDIVEIRVRLTAFNGVRLAFRYEVYDGGALSATGESRHCFLSGGVPVNLKKRFPALCASVMQAVETL